MKYIRQKKMLINLRKRVIRKMFGEAEKGRDEEMDQ